MARNVPYVGEVSYNGFRFPPALAARCTVEPIYTSDERALKFWRLNFSVEGIITPDDAADSAAGLYGGALAAGSDMSAFGTALTKFLTVPGRKLTFDAQGIFQITLNAGDGTGFWDAMNGPKPQVVIAEPVGSNRAIRIVWECVAHIVPCDQSSSSPLPGPVELTYDARFSITPEGMTQRTITGTLEIRHSLVGAPIGDATPSSPYDVADNYRDYITVPIVPGFHRRQEYNLSRDKRILEFLIVDTEIPSDNPLFPNIVDMDISHQVRNLEPMAFVVWTCRIGGEVTIAPGVSRHVAWLAFLAVVSDRLFRTVNGIIIDSQGNVTGSKHLLDFIDIEEPVFGRTMSFSITYRLWATLSPAAGPDQMQSLFAATGLFEKLPPTTPFGDFNWNTWASSLADNVFDRRGYAKMGLTTSDDFIVNHCNARTLSPNANLLQPYNPEPYYLFTQACPPVERSWVENKVTFQVWNIPNVIGHRKIKQTALSEVQDPATQPDLADAGFKLPATPPEPESTTVQIRGRPQFILVVRAYAQRHGYTIPQPQIKRFGGLDVTPIDPKDYGLPDIDMYLHYQKQGGPCPIYEMIYCQHFLLPQKPQSTELEGNVEGTVDPELYRLRG